MSDSKITSYCCVEVCLGSTQGVTKSCCDDHKNLRDLRTPSTSSGIYAIVIDGSTFQYIDSVTARVLREVRNSYSQDAERGVK